MDWLKRIPVIGPRIGPLVDRLARTHVWRSYETLDRVHWTRLAAAITFISFIAVFPLITVSAAIGAALLSQGRLDRIKRTAEEQVPGISGELDIDALVANAGTVGLVAGALLLFTGIGWIGSMRECLRAVWELDKAEKGNPIVLKAKDAVVLAGLGAVGLGSLGVSTFGSTAIGWTAARLGIPEGGVGGAVLQTAVLLVAVGADFMILLYVLTLLPQVQPARHRLLVAALIGAVGFELLKLLIGGYIKDVAAKSTYGAFGVPVALLLWINFTAKLLLFCAAWTATPDRDTPAEDEAVAHDGGGAARCDGATRADGAGRDRGAASAG
ncbi:MULTISPECIES: YihY/virulence factor BrkB family protein [unclassified Streptomyces]|uniref:YihY/virulence factor BrkB family protein n=1 Tax=unclassified Streptomyces TaxID=2593676 RepID=UPI00081D8306|nr:MULTISPECIES: YihY/virulence factor BrkB family protein [unclassified Streptomyces]MYZ37404.1 YihY/virulence factor BrkB family protein [Streptomyces sp. SID4917]SCF91067.1 membrane protein [Streptomyces sp. MnatMP-M17]